MEKNIYRLKRKGYWELLRCGPESYRYKNTR
jgi:hypothetical protein